MTDQGPELLYKTLRRQPIHNSEVLSGNPSKGHPNPAGNSRNCKSSRKREWNLRLQPPRTNPPTPGAPAGADPTRDAALDRLDHVTVDHVIVDREIVDEAVAVVIREVANGGDPGAVLDQLRGHVTGLVVRARAVANDVTERDESGEREAAIGNTATVINRPHGICATSIRG